MSILLVDTPVPHVRRLTLNRPHVRNALSTALLARVGEELRAADTDEAVRVTIISGGPSVFAAGADIAELQELDGTDPFESPRYRAWREVRNSHKPVIASVEGWCLGGGFELALACDFIVASESAEFGMPETGLGIMPGGGGSAILPRLLGPYAAARLILAGGRLSAREAASFGLLYAVSEPEKAGEASLELAAGLAQRAPLALIAAKASIREAANLPLEKHLELERREALSLYGSRDKQEGVRAFLEKRSPVWEGR